MLNIFAILWNSRTFKRYGTGDGIPSLCRVLTDDAKDRSTWLWYFHGSSRRFLCSEKELVSFPERNSTP